MLPPLAHGVLVGSSMRGAAVLFVLFVFALNARPARCERSARSPSTIVAALVEGDPANDVVEAAARDVARALTIERESQARVWQSSAPENRPRQEAPEEGQVPQAEGTRARTFYVDAIRNSLQGKMSDSSLAISYASPSLRDQHIGHDAAAVAFVLAEEGQPRGDGIAVMSEGGDIRVVHVNESGVPLRTLRASPDKVLEAVERMIDGASASTIGDWQPGLHRVVVDVAPTAPEVSDMRSDLDHQPMPARAFCKARHCAFAAPPGMLRMRFDESEWSGSLEKRIELDKDVRITVTPGRRYWAKYAGFTLITAGMSSVLVVMIVAGLEGLAVKAVDSVAPDSGPDDGTDDGVKASPWEAAMFFGGAATIAAGVILYKVVHKKPRIQVSPLGGAALAF